MKKIFTYLIWLIPLTHIAYAYNDMPFEYKYYKHWKAVYHPHNESSYQHAHCKALDGVEEYELPDKTRVDCLTDKYAIEYDFANKKYEAVGQALHYAVMTGKKPKVVLILDKKFEKRQLCYYERIKRIGEAYGFEVEYITDDILNLDKNGNCAFLDCKCRVKHK